MNEFFSAVQEKATAESLGREEFITTSFFDAERTPVSNGRGSGAFNSLLQDAKKNRDMSIEKETIQKCITCIVLLNIMVKLLAVCI
jgi:hypothetical protein